LTSDRSIHRAVNLKDLDKSTLYGAFSTIHELRYTLTNFFEDESITSVSHSTPPGIAAKTIYADRVKDLHLSPLEELIVKKELEVVMSMWLSASEDGDTNCRHGLLSGANNVTGFDHIFESIDKSSKTSKILKDIVILNLKLQETPTSLPSLLELITQGDSTNNLSSGVVIKDSYTSNPADTLNHFYTLVAGCLAREQINLDRPLSKSIISSYGFQEIFRGRDGFT
jgi:hypothetical protein